MSQAKSLRPITLMSIVLKNLSKYCIYMSGEVSWLKNHYISTNLPTGQVCLQKQLSSRLFIDWKRL
jgi:hypothetical protein